MNGLLRKRSSIVDVNTSLGSPKKDVIDEDDDDDEATSDLDATNPTQTPFPQVLLSDFLPATGPQTLQENQTNTIPGVSTGGADVTSL